MKPSTSVIAPLVLLLSVGDVAMAAVTAEQCREILKVALKNGNPQIRRQAAVALSLAASRDPYFSLLRSALSDNDVDVRIAAISSMSENRSREATAALEKAVHDDTPEVSFAAAKALLMRSSPAGKEALLSVLEGETKAQSNFFTRQKRDTLRMMHTPKGVFLFAVRQGIGFAGVPGLGEGVASMQSLLGDPGVSGRATAALLLGRERDARTLAALKEALSDKEWSVRAAAVHSLALRNDPSVLSSIAPLVEDKKEEVRLRAAAAWLRLHGIRQPASANRLPRSPGAASPAYSQ